MRLWLLLVLGFGSFAEAARPLPQWGNRTYYAILGLPESATQDELKSAFRQLAKKFHPDINPGNEKATNEFKAVAEAWSVLGEPAKRAAYDRTRGTTAPPRPSPSYQKYQPPDAAEFAMSPGDLQVLAREALLLNTIRREHQSIEAVAAAIVKIYGTQSTNEFTEMLVKNMMTPVLGELLVEATTRVWLREFGDRGERQLQSLKNYLIRLHSKADRTTPAFKHLNRLVLRVNAAETRASTRCNRVF